MLRLKLIFPALALALTSGVFAQSAGTPFCNPSNNNSTLAPAVLAGTWGSGFGSDLHLNVTGGAPGQICYILVGESDAATLAISDGLLCLNGGPFYRYNVAGTLMNSIGGFDGTGTMVNAAGTSTTGFGFDVPSMIPATAPFTILAGDTFHFQAWYRDTPAGAGHSNFTNGLSVTFLGSQTVPIAGMVLIPTGTFEMGSNEPNIAPYFNRPDAQPLHSVTISQSFWMGEHEVTQADYLALMGVNPSTWLGPNLPVEGVSWSDAVAYCTALTAQEQAAGNVPAGKEYRLPTEAEWEYSCRAGTTTEFNVGTDLFCSNARFLFSRHSNSACSVSSPIDVGSFAPNAFDLYDMHGNVSEWCLDSWSDYSASAVTDPYVSGGQLRVLRGGHYGQFSNKCRSTFRRTDTGAPSMNKGFRVVLAEVLDNSPVLLPGMVLIPAGTFEMGSDAANAAPYFNRPEQKPVHTVTISEDFWMGEAEVTQAEYQTLMGTNPSGFIGVNLPVEMVAWDDAVAYCTALTAQQQAIGNLPVGVVYRLPTEAEWEFACRAGTTTEYNVGASLLCSDAQISHGYLNGSIPCGNGGGDIDVKSYAPNSLGLYDMHGNVFEWCLDSWSNYNSGPVTDPFVSSAGWQRIIRGGSWNSIAPFCRSASRGGNAPDEPDFNIGFRVVLAEALLP